MAIFPGHAAVYLSTGDPVAAHCPVWANSHRDRQRGPALPALVNAAGKRRHYPHRKMLDTPLADLACHQPISVTSTEGTQPSSHETSEGSVLMNASTPKASAAVTMAAQGAAQAWKTSHPARLALRADDANIIATQAQMADETFQNRYGRPLQVLMKVSSAIPSLRGTKASSSSPASSAEPGNGGVLSPRRQRSPTALSPAFDTGFELIQACTLASLLVIVAQPWVMATVAAATMFRVVFLYRWLQRNSRLSSSANTHLSRTL